MLILCALTKFYVKHQYAQVKCLWTFHNATQIDVLYSNVSFEKRKKNRENWLAKNEKPIRKIVTYKIIESP